jgi:2-succinyl-6-hydroxy-2,4-cyclohexadiene-1-carboxylate synthase
MFKLNTVTRGNPGHPPLIFLHGFLGAKEDWASMFPFFESRFFCIAFDLPGHARTAYSDDILSTIKTAIDGITSTKPLLIGYSMGGRIALQLQESASALIALSAHPGLASREEKETRKRIDQEWADKLLHLPFDTFLAEWYTQPIFHSFLHNPTFLKTLIKRRKRQNPKHLALVLKQMSLVHQKRIKCFLCPTLFMYGEEDWKYRQLYCKLPQTVAVRSVKDAAHAVHLENPTHCAEQILTWLDLDKENTDANT